MTEQWVSHPSPDRALLERAHAEVLAKRTPVTGVRQVVHESWLRSLDLALDPDKIRFVADLSDAELRDYRNEHPLSRVLPTIHKLLVRHTFDANLIVAVGDQAGRLLWIDGDRQLRRKAEAMAFVEGAHWSEEAVGTSAPGTALRLDQGIQIRGAEHFGRIVHPWSCTAVPIHDPATGTVIGVIDITGGEDAAAPATLPLLEAAVAAVEAELRVQRLDDIVIPRVRHAPAKGPALLTVLGRDVGELTAGGRSTEVSQRHAEILTLLAWNRGGLSAERLAELVYGRQDSHVTVRAEMVRLRKVIGESLAPLSRPYRLTAAIETDAHRVLAFLDRGAHKVALAAYAGPLLPSSEAPGIVELRRELADRLRQSLLADASVDTLLDYARTDEAAYDLEVWRACLQLLPAKSPKRSGVVSRIERIETELSSSRN